MCSSPLFINLWHHQHCEAPLRCTLPTHVPLRPSPVVLHIRRLISDGCQVHFSLLPVGQAQQLFDHVVGHLLHELQGLHVVAPRGEDLVQPGEVLVQAALHAAHGACHLEDRRGRGGGEVNGTTAGEEYKARRTEPFMRQDDALLSYSTNNFVD